MIAPLTHIAAMAPYARADLAVADGVPAISLAQNESAYPPSPDAVAAASRALATAALYPDPDWHALRAAIAEVHGVANDDILCGAGSMELIACLMGCYAGPCAEVLTTAYGYAFFRTAAQAVSAPVATAPEREFTVDVDALLAHVGDTTRIVCIANPGNPTGTRLPRAEIVRLRDGLRDDILLVIDEAYGEFADMPGEATFDLVARGDTVVLRTFSKAYALAGLRIGWGVFPPPVAAEMRKLLNPNNVSIASQAAAAAAMTDQTHMRGTVEATATQRDRFATKVRSLGITVPESQTNFVLMGFVDADAAMRVDRYLREHGIIMRAMSGYGLPHCLRATISAEDHMDRAFEILVQWHAEAGR